MNHYISRISLNFQAGQLLELFLVAAISSLLAIRFYLHLTDYPQLGGESLHIAHMLWGGLLMMVALVAGILFIGRRVASILAVVGGVGFGVFIDELGKFITKDNDYFFQPTIALLYILFVSLFLVFRYLERRLPRTQRDYLINALHLLEEGALQQMDEQEKQKALHYLKQADQNSPLTQQLTKLLMTVESIPNNQPGWLQSWKQRLSVATERIINHSLFDFGIMVYFIGRALILLAGSLLTLTLSLSLDDPLDFIFPDTYTIADWGYVISSMVAGALLIWGVLRMRTSKLEAYELFQRSVLVSILFSQVFVFYREQLSALLILVGNLMLFAALHFLIRLEEVKPSQ